MDDHACSLEEARANARALLLRTGYEEQEDGRYKGALYEAEITDRHLCEMGNRTAVIAYKRLGKDKHNG